MSTSHNPQQQQQQDHDSTPAILPQKSSNNDISPDDESDARTYQINLQLAQLAQQAQKQQRRHRRNDSQAIALQALDLFENNNLVPDTVSYNSLLKVLAKVSPCQIDHHAPHGKSTSTTTSMEIALDKFREMQRLHREQWAANRAFYAQLAAEQPEASSSSNDSTPPPPPLLQAPRVRVRPNSRSYATLMDACSRTGTVQGATQCQALLEELQHAYVEHGRTAALEPNHVVFNTALAAWAKVGGSRGALRCIELLQDMTTVVQPDRITYNTVLNALAKSGRADAGTRAQQILQRTMVPAGLANARSYATVLDAWGRSSGRPDRAHALLNEWTAAEASSSQTNNNNNNNNIPKPNIVSYTTVIHAYAVSKQPDKAARAYQVFCDMRDKAGIRPNRVAYNAMLNCCATSRRPNDPVAVDLVMRLYREFLRNSSGTTSSSSHHRGGPNDNNVDDDDDDVDDDDDGITEHGPDVVTLATVLKACSNLMIWRKDPDFAPLVFREACARGCVSPTVLWQFRQAVPVDTYREMLHPAVAPVVAAADVAAVVSWNDLPAAWTCHAPSEEGYKKSRNKKQN